ncbi:copper resistance protein CopC [Microbacterium sp. ET2]|uniref:copper resistance CopC family protein n=1 Tax=Microbacterium albipurpureum TaxID=3050384 RepID=UPI00259D0F9B|nr:copper resistance CopC family protein [Microbacterium sp. ET2 (Ac-2212)]WJL95369.1 copper resistance protein CopC [Microbacterium sp. ET2 (Ac-2212)]
MSRSGLRFSPVRAIIGVIVLLTAVFALPVAASAHDELLGSDPTPGSTLDQAPAAITLTFSGLISQEPGATVIEVTDAAGTALVDGSPTTTDNVVSQPLTAAQPGAVTVLWKVVSSDGHPISGELSFTVAEGAAPSPTADATAAPAPDASASPSPSASTAETSSASPSPADAGDPASATAAVVPWIIVGIVAVAAGGAIVYLLLARAKGRTPGTGGGADR